ncbi:MAG: phage integrase N-terminal SAM-like domain-containing protein [Phycisphaeraceae bacterium]|nr:phage integrase N-terminal SAM-like domain-containing protein [Phycisphaeraceae bacterium]
MTLREQFTAVIRRKHYSCRTDRTCWSWIMAFLRFHRGPSGWRHPSQMGAAEVEAFLTRLAVQRRVAAATQNQALNAIVFLYRHVLEVDLGAFSAVRARKTRRRHEHARLGHENARQRLKRELAEWCRRKARGSGVLPCAALALASASSLGRRARARRRGPLPGRVHRHVPGRGPGLSTLGLATGAPGRSPHARPWEQERGGTDLLVPVLSDFPMIPNRGPCSGGRAGDRAGPLGPGYPWSERAMKACLVRRLLVLASLWTKHFRRSESRRSSRPR